MMDCIDCAGWIGEGKGEDLIPNPSNSRETTDGKVGELVERGGREVEVGDSAAFATVCEGNYDALSLV